MLAPHDRIKKVLNGHRAPEVRYLLVMGLFLLSACAAPASDRRPNIIFMYSDDHAARAIGAYRDALKYGLRLNHSPTPNIDRLASQGMRFDNAFVTNSICKPSRAVLLTGLHSHLNGVPTNRQQIDPHLLTFPKLLTAAGYRTAIIGKWHLGTTPRGFNHFEVLDGQGPYYNPRFNMPGRTVRRTGYTGALINERALHWLKNRTNTEAPFMLIVNHKAPHRNWLPGPKYLNTYDDRSLAEPGSLFADLSGLASPARNQNLNIATFMEWGWDLKMARNPLDGSTAAGWPRLKQQNNLTDRQLRRIRDAYRDENRDVHDHLDQWSQKKIVRWKYQRYIKDYLRTIRRVDDGVGRLMAYLKNTGQADNTVFVYSSDQGFFLGENGWFDKRWIYEESLRQPLIVRWPGHVKPGSTDEHLVQNLDFAPTLLDLAGVEIPDRMQGRSLVPLLKGTDPSAWRDAVYYHYYEGRNMNNYGVPRHYGLRTDRYTLARYYTAGAWELFDLKTDPEQLDNVYDDPAYREVRKRLKKKLDRLREKFRDQNPTESVADIRRRQQKMTENRRRNQ